MFNPAKIMIPVVAGLFALTANAYNFNNFHRDASIEVTIEMENLSKEFAQNAKILKQTLELRALVGSSRTKDLARKADQLSYVADNLKSPLIQYNTVSGDSISAQTALVQSRYSELKKLLDSSDSRHLKMWPLLSKGQYTIQDALGWMDHQLADFQRVLSRVTSSQGSIDNSEIIIGDAPPLYPDTDINDGGGFNIPGQNPPVYPFPHPLPHPDPAPIAGGLCKFDRQNLRDFSIRAIRFAQDELGYSEREAMNFNGGIINSMSCYQGDLYLNRIGSIKTFAHRKLGYDRSQSIQIGLTWEQKLCIDYAPFSRDFDKYYAQHIRNGLSPNAAVREAWLQVQRIHFRCQIPADRR